MLQNISFRTTRAIHICIVFSATLIIQEIFNYPRAAWTGFAVMMIYVGFDPGSTIRRTFHRFWGMVLGLFLSYILWFFGHIDYRILFFVVPICIFFAYYSLGKLYMFPTIFTVTLTALGSDYYSTNAFPPVWFFSDYIVCTVIALIICVFFEYFIFRGSKLTNKFYYDLLKDITESLNNIFTLTTKTTLHKSKLLKFTVHLNSKILELNALLDNTQHSYQANNPFNNELKQFFNKAKLVYQLLRELEVYHPHNNTNSSNTVIHLIGELIELSNLIKNNQSIYFSGEAVD
jgi:uncharacterized membrane protein YccC